MRKTITIMISLIVICALCVNSMAASYTFVLPDDNSSDYSGYESVPDYNNKWYVYVSYVSFSGMPSGTHPANYEVYFRPYSGSTPVCSTHLTFKYRTSGSANIGVTGASKAYKYRDDGVQYGGHGESYRLKSNSDNYSKGQTVFTNWTP